MLIKILGLGHYMKGDDEIGLEIVRRWKEQYEADFPADQIEADCLEGPGINLLAAIAGLGAAVLVDALQSGAPGGTVIQLNEDNLGTLSDNGPGHGWGAAETLSLGREMAGEDLPETIIIIGVEGAVFTLGEGLSPAVRAAIPAAVDLVSEVVRGLLEDSN